MTNPEQKKANVKTGLILLSIVMVFFLGFVGKIVFLSN